MRSDSGFLVIILVILFVITSCNLVTGGVGGGNDGDNSSDSNNSGTVTPTPIITPIPTASPGDATVDLDAMGYEIRFTLDGTQIIADSFAPFSSHDIGIPYHITDYQQGYYDGIMGTDNDVYCEVNDYVEIPWDHVVVHGKAVNGTDSYYVNAIVFENSFQITGLKTDEAGFITERFFTHTFFDNTVDVLYSEDETVTFSYPDSVVATGEVLDSSSNGEISIDSEYAISHIAIKAKVSQVVTISNDTYVRASFMDDNYDFNTDVSLRNDYAIRVYFNKSSDDAEGGMDTSIKDLYVNGTLVQGAWSTGTRPHSAGTFDILTYTPPANWESDSIIYVDVPITHKSTAGDFLTTPKTFYFKTGSTSVSSPVFDRIDNDDFWEVQLVWNHELDQENVRFEIYRADSELGQEILICNSTSDSNPDTYYTFDPDNNVGRYYDRTVEEGQTYYYKIKAISTINNDSAESPVKSSSVPSLSPLTADIWNEGEITHEMFKWYSLDVTPGSTYMINFDHAKEGSGQYTAEAMIYVYSENQSGSMNDFFHHEENLYTIPIFFTAITDKIYIKAELRRWSLYDTSSKTYAIKVSETTRLPAPTITTTNGNDSIDVSWTDDSDCDLYYVYRDVYNDGKDYELLVTTTTTTYFDTDVTPGVHVNYKIIGKKGEQFTEFGKIEHQLYFTGYTTTEITEFGVDIEGSFSENYWDVDTAVVYSFSATASKTYTITLNDGSGSYSLSNTLYVYDSTGKMIDSLSESNPVTVNGDGNVYYIGFKYYYSGDTYSIRVDESM